MPMIGTKTLVLLLWTLSRISRGFACPRQREESMSAALGGQPRFLQLLTTIPQSTRIRPPIVDLPALRTDMLVSCNNNIEARRMRLLDVSDEDDIDMLSLLRRLLFPSKQVLQFLLICNGRHLFSNSVC